MTETVTRWAIEQGPEDERWFFTGRLHAASGYPKWSRDVRRAQFYHSLDSAFAVAEEFGLEPFEVCDYWL